MASKTKFVRSIKGLKRGPSLAALRKELGGVVSTNWRAVFRYLQDRCRLRAALPAVCAKARDEFGPGAELDLEVYADPEIDDRYLSLYVRMADFGPDRVERFANLSERIAADLEKTEGDILVTTDFRDETGLSTMAGGRR
jgi:hypothetical protein